MPVDAAAVGAFDRLDPCDFADMDFSSLICLINQPSVPAGGAATVRRVIDLARLRRGCSILEVGGSTGFSAIEFASWVDGTVTGLDASPAAAELARERAAMAGVHNVRFDVGDWRALPYPDRSFDLVFCGNVTSFTDDRVRASDEYHRVLDVGGILAAVPIYYAADPPESLRQAVSTAIGVDLPVTTQAYWTDLFASRATALVAQETYEYIPQSAGRIAEHVATVLDQPHLHALPPRLRDAAAARLTYFYTLFEENLTYARFDILICRRGYPNPERILHRARLVDSAA